MIPPSRSGLTLRRSRNKPLRGRQYLTRLMRGFCARWANRISVASTPSICEEEGIMLATVDAALAELEEEPVVPEGETSLQLLQAIYKNRKQPLNVRVRCAIEALAHEYPKVSAVQVSHMNGQDFASALERAIARSKAPLALNAPAVIEHEPAQQISAEE